MLNASLCDQVVKMLKNDTTSSFSSNNAEAMVQTTPNKLNIWAPEKTFDNAVQPKPTDVPSNPLKFEDDNDPFSLFGMRLYTFMNANDFREHLAKIRSIKPDTTKPSKTGKAHVDEFLAKYDAGGFVIDNNMKSAVSTVALSHVKSTEELNDILTYLIKNDPMRAQKMLESLTYSPYGTDSDADKFWQIRSMLKNIPSETAQWIEQNVPSLAGQLKDHLNPAYL